MVYKYHSFLIHLSADGHLAQVLFLNYRSNYVTPSAFR